MRPERPLRLRDNDAAHRRRTTGSSGYGARNTYETRYRTGFEARLSGQFTAADAVVQTGEDDDVHQYRTPAIRLIVVVLIVFILFTQRHRF
jgi:hypothetical protein